MHGTQTISRIRGLIKGNPAVGWGFMLGVMAIVGLPPFGVFTSEFLILTATIKDAPAWAPFLLLGLAVAFAALLRRVQPMVSGEPPPLAAAAAGGARAGAAAPGARSAGPPNELRISGEGAARQPPRVLSSTYGVAAARASAPSSAACAG